VTTQSALYVGSVMHRRLRPKRHAFRYRAFWLLLDLDTLETVSKSLRWFSYNRPNLFSLYDRDHGDGSATPLRTQVDRLLTEAGIDPAGMRVQLLCMPRTMGYCFNPLSLYFCSRADGTLAAVIYQVHNTFSERHSYVMPVQRSYGALHQSTRKVFYVSPFMDMDLRYDFRITGPDDRIVVGIRASQSGVPVLNANMAGLRLPLTDRNLVSVFLRIPAVSIKVIAAIHWEALRLWIKGVGLRRRPSYPPHAAAVVPGSPTIMD
jgi:uncharacterized protein